jgi:glycosyltransferase involved in cell wall biosynthesis
MTLVSAIVPTFNRNDLLFSRSLPSILRSTYRNVEVLIVADGMEGEQLEDLQRRIREAQFETDFPLLCWNIERPDYPADPGNFWSVQGWAARNYGLDHAHGEWITALDDDDEWTDDHIEVLLRAVTEKGVDFAYGKSVTPWNQWYGHWPPSAMNFTDGSQLYRNGMGYRYDPECITRWLPADGDLWTRMVQGGVTFTFLDQLVHRYYPADR